MTFSRVFALAVPLMAVLLLSVQILPTEAENVYLFRLKKLRNSLHSQIEDQVETSDAIVEASYGDTVELLVRQISSAHQEAIQEITAMLLNFTDLTKECEDSMPKRPSELFTMADGYLQGCIVEAEEGSETISNYVITDTEKFQTKSSDFSLWFLTAYLSDIEDVYSEAHYNSVYSELSAHVVEWDNVGSIELFQFRQQVIKQLGNLSTSVDDCTIRMKEFIAAEFDTMYTNSLNCR